MEQGDPLAEADFHMAYGLYDQAADIVKLAIEREPQRRELRLKLLEVYFVWGNKDSFLDVARELGRGRDQAPPGEWEKVVIMGRQIAPDDALFAGATGSAAAAAAGGVDLDLDNTGIERVDLELLADADAKRQGEDVDLDLGQALAGADSLADTGESIQVEEGSLDLSLDGAALGGDRSGDTTKEMTPRSVEPTVERPRLEPTVERPRLEPTVERRKLDAPTVESDVSKIRAEAPTVESPTLRPKPSDHTIREKLDTSRFTAEKNRADQTSELALDDLGFDVDALAGANSLPALENTDHPADAPTMVAGMDEKSRQMLRAASRGAEDDVTQLAPHAEPTRQIQTGGKPKVDVDLNDLTRALESDTVEQRRPEETKFSAEVFATGRFPAGNGQDVDLDLGNSTIIDRAPTVTERIQATEVGLPELEPVTLSEVGTKLDLARAYMDMGDPEGARSILQEVMTEGSNSQKQEAQRLLTSLPG
jgi:pilus assembly protein FimV